MKKILLTAFFNIILFSMFGQNFDIVTYFQLLPDSVTHGYPLIYENNKWKSKSSVDYPIYPTVDKENGFIEIIDEGTGGGTETVQVALFKSSRQNFIAVSYTFFDGFSMESTISFWKYSKGYWLDYTEKILPEIKLEYFMKDNYKIPENLPENFYNISLTLPRYGTTLKATLWVQQAAMYCDGTMFDATEEEVNMACKFIQNIKNDTFELHWDKNDEKFVF